MIIMINKKIQNYIKYQRLKKKKSKYLHHLHIFHQQELKQKLKGKKLNN